MKYLIAALLFFSTQAYAQYDKFSKAGGPTSTHDFGFLGSAGYAFQTGNFVQLALIYGTNYHYVNNEIRYKYENYQNEQYWDNAICGFGLGVDLGMAKSNFVFAPKVFAEFETKRKLLFYRISMLSYFSGGITDFRALPEIGTYLGKPAYIAFMTGYAIPLGDRIPGVGGFRIGFNVYPGKLQFSRPDLHLLEDKKKEQSFEKKGDIQEPQMVYVKGGSFRMGSDANKYKENKEFKILVVPGDEMPSHEVTMSGFSIGKYEITVGEFREFVKATGYVTEKEAVNKRSKTLLRQVGIMKKLRGVCFWNGMNWQNKYLSWEHDALGNLRTKDQDNHPVIHLTVNDAMKYCEWLSIQTGKKYRLPTEAEWEFAAMGGTTSGFTYSGADILDTVAWHKKNSRKITHPVGLKQPNALGIYDMTGNVAEMCADWYDAHYYKKSIIKDPAGPEESTTIIRYYVLRGGSWGAPAEDCRISRRNYAEIKTASNCFGFRLVREE